MRDPQDKQCASFQDDPDAPGCCIGCGNAREAHMSLKQRAMSMLSRLVNEAPIGKYEAHELVRQLLEAKWNEPSPDPETSASCGKPCTCDNCLGSSTLCRVDAGERLGDLWYCRKRVEVNEHQL